MGTGVAMGRLVEGKRVGRPEGVSVGSTVGRRVGVLVGKPEGLGVVV